MSATRAPRTRRRATTEAQWEYKTDPIQWRVVTTMNVRDLSNDDDFLSHVLIEKLGAGVVPLLVHRMDQARSLPKTKTEDLLAIVHKLVVSKAQRDTAIRQAVDELLKLVGVQYYIHKYEQKQINAFATHACRYFEFYMPSGAIEIAHTDRYTHKTGKSELCILATRPLAVGSIIHELKGSMADLSKEEEYGLKHGEPNSSGLGIRKDFSVIHSRQRKMNHLFLGPARFVNHDCENNVELFRDGRCITFRVIRPIGLGDEVTTHYGSRYFGYKNKDCLCASCERKGKGGYSTQVEDGTLLTAALDEGDSDSTLNPFSSDEDNDAPVNVDERRTRRGVYHVVKDKRRRVEAMQLDDEGVRTGGIETPVAAIEPVAEAASMLPPLPDTRASSSAASETPGVVSRSSSPSMASTPEVTPPTSMSPPRTETVVKWKHQWLESYLPAPPGSINLCELSSTSPGHVATTGLAQDLKSLENSHVLRESTNLGRLDIKGKRKADESRSIRLKPIRDPSLPATPEVNPMRRAIEKVLNLGGSSKPIARAPRSPAPQVEEDDEPEEQTTRSLRPRKPLPERFYDLTVRRIAKLPAHPPMETTPVEPEAEVVVGPEASAISRPDPLPQRQATDKFPKCKTCLKTIPVIYLDHKIVEWGPSDNDTSGEHECPRCMRHFNIYKLRWPRRVNKPGFSHIVTPAGTATPLDPKPSVKLLLNAVDSRLVAASGKPGPSNIASRHTKSGRKQRRIEALEEEAQDDPPVAPARRPKGRPRKADRKNHTTQPLVIRGPRRNGMPHRAVTPTIRLQPSSKRIRGRPRKRAMTPVSVGGSSRARSSISALQAKIDANASKETLRVKLRGRPRKEAEVSEPSGGSIRAQSRSKLRDIQEDEEDSNASGSRSGEEDEDGDTSESDEEVANDLLNEQDDGWATDNEGIDRSSSPASAATIKDSLLMKRSETSGSRASAASSRALEDRTIPAVLLNLKLPASGRTKTSASPTVHVLPSKTPVLANPSTSTVALKQPEPTSTSPTLAVPPRRSPRKDDSTTPISAIPLSAQASTSSLSSKTTQPSFSSSQPSASSSKSVASPIAPSSPEIQRLRINRKVHSSPLTFYGSSSPVVAATLPRSPQRPATVRVGNLGAASAPASKVASSSQRSPSRRAQDIIDLADSDDVVLVSHVNATGSDVIDIDDDDESRPAKKLRRDDGSSKVTASSSRLSLPGKGESLHPWKGGKRPR